MQFGKQARGLVLNKEFFDIRGKKRIFLKRSIDVDVITICQPHFQSTHWISKIVARMIVKPIESGDGDGVPENKYLVLACVETIFWQ